jgi:hypothetical protein
VILTVEVEGPQLQLHLDFEVKGRPRKRIELPLPQSSDTVVIVPDEGRTFGDDETGTPCTVSLHGRTLPAWYKQGAVENREV